MLSWSLIKLSWKELIEKESSSYDASGAIGKPVFQIFYVEFSCLRKGYLEGCRSCVNGCFLKTHIGGALVTRDGNN